MKKVKNLKLYSLLIFIISALLIYFLFRNNFYESIKLLREANPWWILLAVLLYILFVFTESIAMGMLVKEQGAKVSKWEMFKLQFMSKFFDGVTPLSSGGEPFQVYKFKEKGISTAGATAIVVEHFLLFQITIVLMGVIAVLSNYIFNLYPKVAILRYLVLFGFTVNIIVTSVVLTSSVNEKHNKKISGFIGNLLFKLKIIKDKEKISTFFKDYYDGFKKIIKNRKLIVNVCLLICLTMIFNFLIVQCVFNALNIPHSLNIFKTIITGIYIFLIGSFVPMPGGTGGVEFGFLGLFANFVPKKLLPPAMILWRFINYYAPILVGAIIYNFFEKKKIGE